MQSQTRDNDTTQPGRTVHALVASIVRALRNERSCGLRLSGEDFMRFRTLVYNRRDDRALALDLWMAHARLAEAGCARAARQLLELATLCCRNIGEVARQNAA